MYWILKKIDFKYILHACSNKLLEYAFISLMEYFNNVLITVLFIIIGIGALSMNENLYDFMTYHILYPLAIIISFGELAIIEYFINNDYYIKRNAHIFKRIPKSDFNCIWAFVYGVTPIYQIIANNTKLFTMICLIGCSEWWTLFICIRNILNPIIRHLFGRYISPNFLNCDSKINNNSIYLLHLLDIIPIIMSVLTRLYYLCF
jgi:hypothetical protein